MYEAASRAKVPVALHLDHGTTMDCIQLALDLGFTSVMYDGSALSMEDNIARTQDVVRLAEKYGAAVEAEIGSLGRTETGEETVAAYTNPADAIIFAHETHVDAWRLPSGTPMVCMREHPLSTLRCWMPYTRGATRRWCCMAARVPARPTSVAALKAVCARST